MTFSASFLRWAKEEADRPYIEADRRQALAELAAVRIDRTTAQVDPYASDRELRELAQRRADLLLERIAALCEPVTVEWINAQVLPLEARPLAYQPQGGPLDEQLQAIVKRVCCQMWWRRQVRRAAGRKREAIEQRAGRVSVRTSQPYISDAGFRTYEQRQAANRAILERTELESEDGEFLQLLRAVEASTANPAIRRGELMTRIRGAEEWAAASGMVGIFTTNTAPSRFHAVHWKKGETNHRFTGGESHPGAGNFGPVQPNTPRDAQQWLCKTWARARAAIKRQRLRMFGFRVAEPHHDGTPHWHMLLWVDAAQVEALQTTMRRYWLADHPDEQGAEKHRVKFDMIDPAKGGACAYVAKYIAKNIDDAGAVEAEGHRDEQDGEQIEFHEGGNKARRVMAWASRWGIRQFQGIGQPPVTVWRELRRVSDLAAQGASPCLQAARTAVNRDGERRADWRAYMQAQGGAMLGREYRLKLATEAEGKPGRYGTSYAPRPFGVVDAARPGEVVLSERRQWKPRGNWTADEREQARKGLFGQVRDWLAAVPAGATPREAAAVLARPQAAPAWTRVNNCTQGPRVDLMKAGIVGASFGEPGGFEDSKPWAKPPTPPTPAPTAAPTPPRPSASAPNDWHSRLMRHRHSVACAPT